MHRLVCAILCGTVVACGGGTEPPRVAIVEIVPSPANVQRDRTIQLQAFTLGVDRDTIRGRAVTFESLNPSVATVTTSGLLTGVETGTTQVVATAGAIEDTALVIVSGFSSTGSLSDDFTSYPGTAGFLSNTGKHGLYPVVENTQFAEIDQSVLYDGHQTLKMSQPANTGHDLVLFVDLPEPVSNMWLRSKARFSPGWKPSTLTQGGADTFQHWGWAGSIAQRGEISIMPDSAYRLTWFATGATGLVSADAGSVGNEWSNGQWMDIIIHYERINETTTRTRMWMAPDGQTPVLVATVNGTMATGSAPLVNRVRISPEYRWPLSQAQAVWLGQWEIVHGTVLPNPFGLPSA